MIRYNIFEIDNSMNAIIINDINGCFGFIKECSSVSAFGINSDEVIKKLNKNYISFKRYMENK